MKKTILAISISLFFPCYSFAQDHEASAASAAKDMSYEDEELERKKYDEQFRAEVERLYPEYIKIDAEDELYAKYVDRYKDRDLYSHYFQRAYENLNNYQKALADKKFKELNPKKSKMDALVYLDVQKIYQDLESLQNEFKQNVNFNAVILDTVKVDQPFPGLTYSERRKYESALSNMFYDQREAKRKIEQLVQDIDSYSSKIEQFSAIESRKQLRSHLNNISDLNFQILFLSHYFNAQLNAEKAFTYAITENSEYFLPQQMKKVEAFIQSAENREKVKTLFAAIPPNEGSKQRSYEEDQILSRFESEASQCENFWTNKEIDKSELQERKLTRAQFIAQCDQTKKDIRQELNEKVFLDEVRLSQEGILTNLDYLQDFNRYGNTLYYTETEKNAVYQFDLNTLKEELIYQKTLPQDDGGCTHNMCRGVGATDIVLSPDQKYAYVASLDYDQVSVIDLKTKQIVKNYKVERYPRKLLIDEKGEYLFVYNGVANSISRIRLKNDEIKTVALPTSHQEHFCREIDLKISPITGHLQILGDWSNDPYVYMDTKEMVFWSNILEVPHPIIQEIDQYRYLVSYQEQSTENYGVYDLRLNSIVQNLYLKPTQMDQSDHYDINYYDHTYIDRYGVLGDQYRYFVVNGGTEKYQSLYTALKNEENELPSQFNLHLMKIDEKEPKQISFKLPNQPVDIELLSQDKILVSFADHSNLNSEHDHDISWPKKIAIYDLKDPKLQSIVQNNASKVFAKFTVDLTKFEPKD